MELSFPIEFVVHGRPVSFQAKNAAARNDWKERVKAASEAVIARPHFASDQRMAVTLYYLADQRVSGDVDNIVKLVLDALGAHIYIDDAQVERIVVQKFEPDNVFAFAAPTATVVEALAAPKPVLYVRVFERSIRGLAMSSMIEEELLQREVARLKSEGFDVFLHPGNPPAPAFIGDFIPDAVALGKGRKIVVEVARNASDKRLVELADKFQRQREWEFKLLVATTASPEPPLAVQSRQSIADALAEIERLHAVNGWRAGFLLAWAAFEAVGRAAMRQTFERPQTPARIVDVLGSQGVLTPSEADRMRELANKRTRLIHGDLDIAVSDTDVQTLVSMLRKLEKEGEAQEQEQQA